MFNGQHAQVPATCEHFKTQCTKELLIEFEDTSMPPTIETYQVLWADDYQTELLPPPIWEKKKKSRAEEKLQLSSLGYVTLDQRNLFYQPPRLICVDCGKKLSTMSTCIGNNKKWPTYCNKCDLMFNPSPRILFPITELPEPEEEVLITEDMSFQDPTKNIETEQYLAYLDLSKELELKWYSNNEKGICPKECMTLMLVLTYNTLDNHSSL
ncbi:hypothetical protein G9A89_001290 [Geosiphon pyriformis]|nr:hypothetical protein G9A89_001290 [Geosiphon pyriformis]